MKGTLLCCFVVVLQMVSWACVTSRPFAPNDGHTVRQPGPEPLKVTLSSKEGSQSMVGEADASENGSYKVVSKIGSTPPTCEHKCFGCTPCEPVQVPAAHSHVGVQYANYEPEGWKCKCGPSFYCP